MPVYRYVLHPGAGQNPSSGGGLRTVQEGTEFTWQEVLMPKGQDTESHFQSIVIPDGVLGAGNLTFICTFRQIGAAVGTDVRLDLKFLQVTSGPRDSAPASIGPVTYTTPAVANGEFSYSFTTALAAFSADEEVAFQVHRIGTSGADDLGADIALVRVEVKIPAADSFIFGSAWNDPSHPVLGAYHLWIDAAGRLRIKSGAPAADTDGTIVGTQS